ncbi:MAG: DUF47 family protein [Alicyclobacillus sp.]|nr:DUF47 family protein [Alicyclobacillus sp.]
MSGWKDVLFVSREKRFIDYLLAQADATLAGLEVLHQYLLRQPEREAREALIADMSRLEKQGDAIRRQTIQDLRETFVTPIDREDIYALSRSVDDILDYADSTVKELVVYDVVPTPAMERMVDSLRQAVESLRSAIEHMLDDPDLSLDGMVEAKRMENRVEDLYRRANAELFGETDIHLIFKIREVYRHLSNCADRVDEAADIIGSIVIKGNV